MAEEISNVKQFHQKKRDEHIQSGRGQEKKKERR